MYTKKNTIEKELESLNEFISRAISLYENTIINLKRITSNLIRLHKEHEQEIVHSYISFIFKEALISLLHISSLYSDQKKSIEEIAEETISALRPLLIEELEKHGKS